MVNLSQTDIKYLTGAFECLESPLKVDYKKLAVVLGTASKEVAYNGFRAAMKKIEAAKVAKAASAASAANCSKDDDTIVGAADPDSKPKNPKATPKAKATKASKPKSDVIVKPEASDDDEADAEGDTDTSAVEKKVILPKKNARKAEVDGKTNEDTVVTPAPKRVRTKKEPEYDADGVLIKPIRKASAPKVDENGNPVTPKRKPAIPKMDGNGIPITPKPRARKPKETTGTTNGEVDGASPAPKKAKKTKAQQATDEKAAAETKEAAEKVQVEGLMQKVNGVFEANAIKPTASAVDSLASNGARTFAVFVGNGLTNGSKEDVKMEDAGEEGDEVTEEEESGAPIFPVSDEEIEAAAEDYTLILGEEI